MDNTRMLKQIYKTHLLHVRSLNDTLIFVSQAKPILSERRLSENVTQPDTDLIFKLPGQKTARRRPDELQVIFSRYLDSELLESLSVSSVSRTEAFIFDTLSKIIIRYPKKLGGTVQGLGQFSQIPLSLVLDSANLKNPYKRRLTLE